MVCSPILKPINEKQRRFAEAYAANPNATEAAKAAGYSGRTARSQGQRLLTNADIQKYIKDLQEENAAERIATMTDVKIFWSDTMNDKELKRSDRLKASELLAKSAGAFLHIGKSTDDEDFILGEHDGEDVVIYMPNLDSAESCQLPPETEVEE